MEESIKVPNKTLANREPYWDELDAEGKIERIRNVVKELQGTVKRMSDYMNQLIDHEHLDGKMVKRISHPNSESSGGFYYDRHRSSEYF